jgi:hypothetical protein
MERMILWIEYYACDEVIVLILSVIIKDKYLDKDKGL